MMAVVQIGGKQYRVSPGQSIKVEKLPFNVGEKIILDRVLMLKKNGEIELGTPLLEKAKVRATVIEQNRDKKVIVYKYKRRKNYHRKYGHRQPFTRLKIEEIQWEVNTDRGEV